MIRHMGHSLWIALALACGSALAEEIHWAPDIVTARRAALEYKVPVLIHFYGDNCLPCKLLEQNVLTRSEVVETLNKYFICVRVNGSQDRQLAAEYGVHSWPTDVFVGPDGKPLDQGVCKQSPGEYLSVLHNMAVLNRDRNVLLASQQSQQAQQITSQVANYAQPAATAAAIAAAGTNVMGGPLPAAGAVQPGNSNGPNFYAQGVGTGTQQLPGSLAPIAGVTSGPMLAQNQPHAITTAVGAAGNQIAAAAAPHAVNTNTGQMPAVETTAQVPPAVHPSQLNPMLGMVAGAASVPTLSQQSTVANNVWSAQPRVSAGHAQMLDNPHFASAPPLPGATSNMAAAPGTMPNMQLAQSPSMPNATPQLPLPGINPTLPQSPVASAKIPANTVSFQPRAALSVEANLAVAAAQPSAAKFASDTAAKHPAPTASSAQPAALDGYCPVALKSQGAWTKGQPQFAVKHRGRIYNLSSPVAMQEFLQSPDSCSPILSGYDAMIFLNEGKLVEGDIQYGLHEQVSGSILLFSSAESKQTYEQNYERNTQALKIVLRQAGVEQ